MDNILGDEIYENRKSRAMTQDQFAKRYNVSGPAIFKFEKGYLKPSFQLWLRMAKDFKIPEKKAVLMWIKSRLPAEYQSLIDFREMAAAEEGEAYGEPEKPIDFSRFTDRDELQREVLKDPLLPKGLKAMVKDDDIWAIYKPTGHEINILRDAFGRFGKGTKALYLEALQLVRELSGAEEGERYGESEKPTDSSLLTERNALIVFEGDHAWVNENMDRLVEQYPEQWIGVKNCKVIASAPQLEGLLPKLSEPAHTCVEFITRESLEMVL